MTTTAQKITAEEAQAIREWQVAYERTDLVARLTVAALSDYRRNGEILHLGATIENQIDRYEQAIDLEQTAYDRIQQARGNA